MKLKQILYKTCSPDKEKKNSTKYFYFFLSAIIKVWIMEMVQQIRALVALAKDKGLFSSTHIEAPVFGTQKCCHFNEIVCSPLLISLKMCLFLLCMCKYFACLYICVPCAYNIHGGQKRVLEPLGLELRDNQNHHGVLGRHGSSDLQT